MHRNLGLSMKGMLRISAKKFAEDAVSTEKEMYKMLDAQLIQWLALTWKPDVRSIHAFRSTGRKVRTPPCPSPSNSLTKIMWYIKNFPQ